jgi:hypothetical protein
MSLDNGEVELTRYNISFGIFRLLNTRVNDSNVRFVCHFKGASINKGTL